MFNRREFFAGAAAALGTGAAAPALAADALPTLRLGGTPDEDIAIAIYGVQSGIFRRAGLDVDVQRLNNGSADASAVAGGAIDIGKSSVFGLIVAHAKGIPFVLESVSAIYDSADPPNGLVVAKDGPIASAAQLNGKTIAVPALGDLYQFVTTAWIDQNGGDSKTVQYVELAVPLTAAAIVAGRVAAAVIPNPFLLQAVERGDVRVIGRPDDAIAKRFGVTYYFTTRSFATSHADLLSRFRGGIAEAARYAVAHKSEMVPIIADYTKMSTQAVAKMPLNVAAGIDLTMLQPVVDFAAKTKMVPKAFPATEMVDPNALR